MQDPGLPGPEQGLGHGGVRQPLIKEGAHGWIDRWRDEWTDKQLLKAGRAVGGQRKERQEDKLGSPGESVKEKRFLVHVGGETAEQQPLSRAEFTGKRQALGPHGKMARRPGSVSSLLTTH